MRKLVLVLLALALTGCIGPRLYRDENAPLYAATDAAAIAVLDAVPEGAVVLGEVVGLGASGLMIGSSDALGNAKAGAARMGGDAIVVTARGTEPVPSDLIGREYLTVRATVLRVRP